MQLSTLNPSKLFGAEPEQPVSGSIDAVKDGHCYGWAAISGSERPLKVQVRVDGEIAAEGVADGFRADLREAGVGSGNHAFIIEIPDRFRDSQFHNIEAIANGQTFATREDVQVLPKLTIHQFDKDAPWLDQESDVFERELQERVSDGRVREEIVPELRYFRENGFVCLEGAIPTDLIDHALEDVERAWKALPEHLLVVNSTLAQPVPIGKVDQVEGFRSSSFRYLDFHNQSEAAAEIMMNPRVLEFIRAYLDSNIVAMQTLLFENGTQQRSHQDFAYVHSLKPALLAGAWVALEDVHPDAGPLFYYPGSHHRVRKHLFANGTVLAEGDGPHVRAFEEYLPNECESLGLDRVLFMPKKGDVLIWHSALVHGGSPRANLDLTRKSMVSHYSTAEAYPFDRRSPAAKPLTITRNGEAYYGLQREGHEEGQFPLKR